MYLLFNDRTNETALDALCCTRRFFTFAPVQLCFVAVIALINALAQEIVEHILIRYDILFVPSVEGGDQQCCYGDNGDLLTDANGAGSVSRFSATRQPYHYMLHDYWPKTMCSQLAKNLTVYRQLRPSDDCSGYVPPKRGTHYGN